MYSVHYLTQNPDTANRKKVKHNWRFAFCKNGAPKDVYFLQSEKKRCIYEGDKKIISKTELFYHARNFSHHWISEGHAFRIELDNAGAPIFSIDGIAFKDFKSYRSTVTRSESLPSSASASEENLQLLSTPTKLYSSSNDCTSSCTKSSSLSPIQLFNGGDEEEARPLIERSGGAKLIRRCPTNSPNMSHLCPKFTPNLTYVSPQTCHNLTQECKIRTDAYEILGTCKFLFN